MPGTFHGDGVLVVDEREANRIHNKGRFGKPQSGGSLRLHLVEAAYLVEVGRLVVKRDGAPLSWGDFIVAAARSNPDFEVEYLAYRDQRERGFVLERSGAARPAGRVVYTVWPRGSEGRGPARSWLLPVGERATFALSSTRKVVAKAEDAELTPIFALVDEESDVTYYSATTQAPEGSMAKEPAPRDVQGTLLEGRVLVADPEHAVWLHEAAFYGRRVSSGLQLSLVEAQHLAQTGRITVKDAKSGRSLSTATLRRRATQREPNLPQRLAAFGDLRRRGLLVKTGFKFGTHFRAYSRHPDEDHAPFLVQCVDPGYEDSWEPLARAVRLAHSVRKRFVLASPTGSGLQYLTLQRHKP